MDLLSRSTSSATQCYNHLLAIYFAQAIYLTSPVSFQAVPTASLTSLHYWDYLHSTVLYLYCDFVEMRATKNTIYSAYGYCSADSINCWNWVLVKIWLYFLNFSWEWLATFCTNFSSVSHHSGILRGRLVFPLICESFFILSSRVPTGPLSQPTFCPTKNLVTSSHNWKINRTPKTTLYCV